MIEPRWRQSLSLQPRLQPCGLLLASRPVGVFTAPVSHSGLLEDRACVSSTVVPHCPPQALVPRGHECLMGPVQFSCSPQRRHGLQAQHQTSSPASPRCDCVTLGGSPDSPSPATKDLVSSCNEQLIDMVSGPFLLQRTGLCHLYLAYLPGMASSGKHATGSASRVSAPTYSCR